MVPLLVSSSFGQQVSEPVASEVMPAAMLQQAPFVEPRTTVSEQSSPVSTSVLRTTPPTGRPLPTPRNPISVRPFPAKDVVRGNESLPHATADLGELLKKSSSSLSIGVQAKTPIIHDPRIRGSRPGSLAASGSHWVPARADLDTILSKFDSRVVDSTTIIPGPYTSLLGPGFSFTDVQLVSSPRYKNGFESHGQTDAEYQRNGSQFLGHQSVLLGAADWGARFHYANRFGSDYRDGHGNRIPSSFESQEMLLGIGRDWERDSLEFSVLRLDQTDVVFPGYVFDIDFLVTDGYEVSHTHRLDGSVWDAVRTDVWYNRTRFEGNAQDSRKRPLFPILNFLSYTGFTDVDSMSTGYSQGWSLGSLDDDSYRFTIGHDLRFIKQELNEISSGVTLGFPLPFSDRNSPIPESFSVNPGLFAEYEENVNDRLTVKAGARCDYTASDITDDPGKLASVGLDFFPATYSEIVGTNQFDQGFLLLSSHLSLEHKVDSERTLFAGLGFAERAPTLTELYAAQPFMLMLQNGLNNVTGDPNLSNEKRIQLDLGFRSDTEWWNAGIRGFHAWCFDYITFENTQTIVLSPNVDAQAVSLRYVNTEFATLAGLESYFELVPDAALSPFANLRFVEGIDRTRNGRFATTNGSSGNSSQKDTTQVRGFYSGVAGAESEPLPSIPPLETRIGLRWKDSSSAKRWNVELSQRIVAGQNRVATSLRETPTPGFSLTDLRTVLRPFSSQSFVVASGVENLFDKFYREHFDYRSPSGLGVFQPGVNVYLSASVRY
jgi:iron complex outermembrane recepter protein